MDATQEKIYLKALNTYYKLKNQYDENHQKDIHKIINIKGLSWKEKRDEFQKMKRKCINCRRPVGTIFTNKAKALEDKHLLAMCGDRNNPCPLNFDINTSYVAIMTDFINDDEHEISEYKKQIIVDKNDLLFGYITAEQAVAKFDSVKESIVNRIKNYEFEMQQYLSVVDNPIKQELLKKMQTEINANIYEMKTMMREFNKTQNTQYIADIVALNVAMSYPPDEDHEIIPKLTKLMNAKYAYSAVEYNGVDDTYHLIQKPHVIVEFEQDLGEKERGVISMREGLDKNIKLSVNVLQEDMPSLQGVKAKKPVAIVGEQNPLAEMNKIWGDRDVVANVPQNIEASNFLPDGTIAASEAANLNLKITFKNGNLIVTDPKSGKIYKVTAGK
uniref:Uncharacterized protein n=1 Tax=viral metagenome TaxID=1070528 RepID=A0A6C0EZF1_9ZZZZ